MEAGLTEALLTLCIATALFYLVRAAGSSSVEVGGSAAMSDSVVTGVAKLGFPWQTSDPFLFCVYHDDLFPPGDEDLGPAIPQHLLWRGRNRGADFGGKWNMYHGEKVPGFPRHPHRGFETVTVVRHGLIDHTDGLGNGGRFGYGDTQWMTAGKGITHSEMFPLLKRDGENRLELFQIWLNLPAASKMAEPYFKMLWSEQLLHHAVSDAGGKKTVVTTVAGKLEPAAADGPQPTPPPNSYAARPDGRLHLLAFAGAVVMIWLSGRCDLDNRDGAGRHLDTATGSRR